MRMASPRAVPPSTCSTPTPGPQPSSPSFSRTGSWRDAQPRSTRPGRLCTPGFRSSTPSWTQSEPFRARHTRSRSRQIEFFVQCQKKVLALPLSETAMALQGAIYHEALFPTAPLNFFCRGEGEAPPIRKSSHDTLTRPQFYDTLRENWLSVLLARRRS